MRISDFDQGIVFIEKLARVLTGLVVFCNDFTFCVSCDESLGAATAKALLSKSLTFPTLDHQTTAKASLSKSLMFPTLDHQTTLSSKSHCDHQNDPSSPVRCHHRCRPRK
jgi:hypothetical protein